MTTAIDKVNGTPVAHAEPRFAPKELAEAAAIRARTEAETEAARLKAEAEAKAIEIKAAEEAERQRIANERARMKLEKDQAARDAYLAEKAAKEAAAKAAKEKTEKAAEEQATEEAERAAEQQRAEAWWKWGARSIYAVGMVIAAPVQFMHFWDRQRPFLVAAPALLEGLALVLTFGAAWAVAHRRDVAPYRVGIMLGAAIAAAINLYGGLSDPKIGLNAGIIGAIASLGGPIVLMAYEHGIAQQADGILSYRERRAAKKKAEAEAAEKARAKAEKKATEEKAAAEKKAAQQRAEAEQKHRDDDRKASHRDVWDVADALRAARGSQYVTEQLWAESWYLVTGCKTVGIRPEIEEQSRAARARMRTVTDMPVMGSLSQINSQRPPRAKKDSDAPDGRRNNGGIPPRRMPGDSQPNSPLARAQASHERTTRAASREV